MLGVGQVRLRWIGHQLRAECEVIVDAGASAVQAHQVAVNAEHDLLHALPRLSAALVVVTGSMPVYLCDLFRRVPGWFVRRT